MSSASRSALVRHVGSVAATAAVSSSAVEVSAAPASAAVTAVPRILCFGDSLTEGYVDRGMTMHPYARRLLAVLRAAGVSCSIDESGVSGELTSQMLPRLSAILAAAKEAHQPYALVILLGGTNDVCHCVSGEIILRQLLQLHSLCHAHSPACKTLGLTIPEIATADPSAAMGKRPKSAETQRMDATIEGVNAAMLGAAAVSGSFAAQLSKGRYSCMDLRTMMPQWSPAAVSDSAAGGSAPAAASSGKYTKDPRGFWDIDDVHFSRAGYDQIGEWIAQRIRDDGLLTVAKTEDATAAKVAEGAGAIAAPVSKI